MDWLGTAVEIDDAISSIPAKLPGISGNPSWTEAIKNTLREIGRAKNFKVAPDPDGFSTQWLYDLIWYQDSDHGTFEVPLVLESEWSLDSYQVRVDYEKLHVAKAALKVMIFQSRTAGKLMENFDIMEVSAQKFLPRSPGEIYLLKGYDLSADNFQSRIVVL